MRLLVGLGNPGTKYAGHRHNVGFMAVDAIVRRHSFSGPNTKFHSELFTGELNGEKVIAIKPQTYMNDSGRAVQAAAAFYKIEPAGIIVIHDELDLDFARIRMKQGGGDAGHNGLRSITAALGADYWRLRFGIGHPGIKSMVADYALHNFDADEQAPIDMLLTELATIANALVNGDVNTVQNRMALKARAIFGEPEPAAPQAPSLKEKPKATK